jgi:hypothetical protein
MKRKTLITTALVCCFMICMAAIADLNGKWSGSFRDPDGNDVDLAYTIKIDGDQLTGNVVSQGLDFKLDSGKVSGTDFKCYVTNPEGVVIKQTGKYFAQGDSISLDIDFKDFKFHSTLKRAAVK